MSIHQLEAAEANLKTAIRTLEMTQTKRNAPDPVLMGIQLAELASLLAKHIGTAGTIDVLVGMAEKLATVNANEKRKH